MQGQLLDAYPCLNIRHDRGAKQEELAVSNNLTKKDNLGGSNRQGDGKPGGEDGRYNNDNEGLRQEFASDTEVDELQTVGIRAY